MERKSRNSPGQGTISSPRDFAPGGSSSSRIHARDFLIIVAARIDYGKERDTAGRGDELAARRTRDSGNRPQGYGSARTDQRRRHRDNRQEEGQLHAALGRIPGGLRSRADT